MIEILLTYFTGRNGSAVPEELMDKLIPSGKAKTGDYFGKSLGITSDNARVFVGAPRSPTNGGSGYLCVFNKLENNRYKEVQKLTGNIQAEFGYSLSNTPDGVSLIVGSPSGDGLMQKSGVVKIFTLQTNGYYIETQTIFAPDGRTNDDFGRSVAVSSNGNIIVVGAPGYDDLQGEDSGAVYVFKKNSSGIFTYLKKLTPINGVGVDYFGFSVGISSSGDCVIAGAYNNDSTDVDSGTAYVFIENNSDYQQSQKLLPSDLSAKDNLGFSLSLSEDDKTLLLGAPGKEGKVHVFNKDNNGFFTEGFRILPKSSNNNQGFGYSVSVSSNGDLVTIGAPGEDTKASDSGAGFIFKKQPDGSYVENRKLLGYDGTALDFLGQSSETSNDGKTIILGSPMAGGTSGPFEGKAYIFNLETGGWTGEGIDSEGTPGGDGGNTTHPYVPGDLIGTNEPGLSGSSYNYLSDTSKNGEILVVSGQAVLDPVNRPTVSTRVGYVYKRKADYTYEQIQLVVPYSNEEFSDAWGFYYGHGVHISENAEVLVFKQSYRKSSIFYVSLSIFRKRTDSAYEHVETIRRINSAAPWNDSPLAISSNGEMIALGFRGTVTNGTLTDEGFVYVFKSLYGNSFNLVQTLKPSNTNERHFGASVKFSTDGLYLGVGVPSDSTKASNGGSIVIYKLSGDNTFVQEQKIFPTSPISGAGFGTHFDLSENATTVVASNFPVNGETAAITSIMVFEKQITGLYNQTQFISSVLYGSRLCISSDGSLFSTGGYPISAGNIHIYKKETVGNYTLAFSLKLPENDTTGAILKTALLSKDGSTAIANSGTKIFNYKLRDSVALPIPALDFKIYGEKIGDFISNDLNAGDYFGQKIAISGDGVIVAVSAPQHDDPTDNSGAVFLFKRNTKGNYEEFQKIFDEDPGSGDLFGTSVAISAYSNLLIVGVPNDDDKSTNSGKLLLYVSRSDRSFSYSQTIYLDFPITEGYFGTNVAISGRGDLFVISNPTDGTDPTSRGRAYVFVRNTWGVYEQRQVLITPPGEGDAAGGFGTTIAVSPDGSKLFVSANWAKETGRNAGCVYVFNKDADNAYKLSQRLVPSNPGVDHYFGASLAVSGDGQILFVGKPRGSVKGTNAGCVYLFKFSTAAGNLFTQSEIIYAPDGGANHKFGSSIGISFDGSIVAFGAEGHSSNKGKVYLYRQDYEGNFYKELEFLHESPNNFDVFGRSLALAPNASVIAIGSPLDDTEKGTDSGSVSFFHLGIRKAFHSPTLSLPTSFTLFSTAYIPPDNESVAGMRFAENLSISQDAGLIAVGSPGEKVNTTANAGTIRIYKRNPGTPGNFTLSQKLLFLNGESAASFGSIMTLSPDGMFLLTGWTANTGHVYVYNRDQTGDFVSLQQLQSPNPSVESFGSSLTISEDNRTIAVSARTAANQNGSTGCVYFYKRVSQSSFEFDFKIEPPSGVTDFGKYIKLSGDGKYLIVAAKATYTTLYVYKRTETGNNFQLLQTLTSSTYKDTANFASSSDISRDGKIIAVSAPLYGSKARGVVFIYQLNEETGLYTELHLFESPYKDYIPDIKFGGKLALSADGNMVVVGVAPDGNVKYPCSIIRRTSPTGGFQIAAGTVLPAGNYNSTFPNAIAISGRGEIWLSGCSTRGVTTSKLFGGFDVVLNLPSSYLDSGILQQPEESFLLPNFTSSDLTKGFYPDSLVTGSKFGHAVASTSNGSYIAVSAPSVDSSNNETGSVFIFRKRSNKSYDQLEDEIKSLSQYENEEFGASLAFTSDGKLLAVSCRKDVDEETFKMNRGHVLVFEKKENDSFVLLQKLSDPEGDTDDFFGDSICFSKDKSVLLIGSPFDDAGKVNSGSVHVFKASSDGSYSYSQKLIASDQVANDYFGGSISISEDNAYLTIGVHADDDKGTDSGSVYIYKLQANGNYNFIQKVTASDGAAGDNFGVSNSISPDGSLLAIGSPMNDTGGNNTGVVYLFTRSGDVFTQQKKIIPASTEGSLNFGTKVNFNEDGKLLLISAPGYGGGKGASYLYKKASGGAYYIEETFTPTSSTAGDKFGSSSCISGDGTTIVSGAPLSPHGDKTEAGKVCIFSYVAEEV